MGPKVLVQPAKYSAPTERRSHIQRGDPPHVEIAPIAPLRPGQQAAHQLSAGFRDPIGAFSRICEYRGNSCSDHAGIEPQILGLPSHSQLKIHQYRNVRGHGCSDFDTKLVFHSLLCHQQVSSDSPLYNLFFDEIARNNPPALTAPEQTRTMQKSPQPHFHRLRAITWHRAVTALFFALASALTLPIVGEGLEPRAFKIQLSETGAYRVTWEQLAALGLASYPASRSLGLEHLTGPVPIWVEDGGDGAFGPGDHFEFLGQHLAGEKTYYHEHSPHNVYRLTLDHNSPARMRPIVGEGTGPLQSPELWTAEHLELDRLMLRFPKSRGERPELWYWARLSHLDRKPFSLQLDLGDYRPSSEAPLSMTLDLRGWSKPRRKKDDPADHRVEVFLGDTRIGEGEWNGQEAFRLEIPAVPDSAVNRGTNQLRLVVPKRRSAPDADPIIDVLMLNWIEIRYPRNRSLGDHLAKIELTPVQADQPMSLTRSDNSPWTLFGIDGSRIASNAMVTHQREGRTIFRFPAPRASTLFAVPEQAWLEPEGILVDHPSHLANRETAADYLMITHPTLRAAIEPLAEIHRQRGLQVAVIDVDDIYDEWNGGIPSPQAIRDFISHAYHSWPRPAPRFVLLVGDASWDIKNEQADDSNYADWTYRPGERRRFVKNGSTPYGTTGARRNLIPTWSFKSSQGHAASDNGFVSIDGDDFLPDLAIGRFPVATAEEVTAIVEKTRRYLEETSIGPWRRSLLWITNENARFQDRTDNMVAAMAREGYSSLKVYPKSSETSNAEHREALLRAFDQGQLLVHFYGHGGRYIWRTGPPDLEKNHDLFTLEDLEHLAPNADLPLVLSMSCYSAPFDHPTADSIGEKFLRLADRGAIGVLAASWRNSPSLKFSQSLIRELTTPGNTIGEAIRTVKNEVGSIVMVEMYNLLGDPAVPLALPELEVELTAFLDQPTPLVTGRLQGTGSFSGKAIVDWLGDTGQVQFSQTISLESPSFSVPFPEAQEPGSVVSVRAYVWNAEVDGIGTIPWPPTPDPEPPLAAAAKTGSSTEPTPSARPITIKGDRPPSEI